MSILDFEHQYMAANSIAHAATVIQHMVGGAVARYEAPSAIYRPAISLDGNRWCALYGDNLQDGVAGFGDSPAAAMADFDANWNASVTGSQG